MMRPPMSTAVTDSPGMPSVSVGMREPPVTALFAASEPATPSMEPRPKSSGFWRTVWPYCNLGSRQWKRPRRGGYR